jgi:hypothetical protein
MGEFDTVSSDGGQEETQKTILSQRASRKFIIDLDSEDAALSTKSRPLHKSSDCMRVCHVEGIVSPMSTPTTSASPSTDASWRPRSRKPSLLYKDAQPFLMNSPAKATTKSMLPAKAMHGEIPELPVPWEQDSAPSERGGYSPAVKAAASAIEAAGWTRLHLEGLDDYLRQRHEASWNLKVAAEQARAEATLQADSFRHCGLESSSFVVVEQLHWTTCAQY